MAVSDPACAWATWRLAKRTTVAESAPRNRLRVDLRTNRRVKWSKDEGSMTESPSYGTGARFREWRPIHFKYSPEMITPLGASPSRNGPAVKERRMARIRLASTVTRALAFPLILRRRFHGTVTKSQRRAGWTGLRFSVMAQLQMASLVRCPFLDASIGFCGAQQIITRGRFCPYPDGWSAFCIVPNRLLYVSRRFQISEQPPYAQHAPAMLLGSSQ
jgi:hypothetical protein